MKAGYSIQLSEERRAALEKLAARLRVKRPRGPRAGAPAWRALVYAIADGTVKLTKGKKKP